MIVLSSTRIRLPFQLTTQRRPRRVVSTHAVHARPRRRRRRTQIDPLDRRRVRIEARDGTEEQLRRVTCPAADVAAHEIGVPRLELTRPHRMTADDAIAKAGREPLDLPFHPLPHVDRRAVGYMTITPERLPTRRRARLVEATCLHRQHVRTLRYPSLPHFALAECDLVHRSAEMHRASLMTFSRRPRHRFS